MTSGRAATVSGMTALDAAALLALEHRGWEALCRSEGGSFYGDLMTEEAVMILPNGMVLDRAATVAALDAAPPWRSYELTDARLVPTGSDCAALVYRGTAWRDGQEEPFVALMSTVYRLVDGTIRLALYQQTTITH
jgi:hypothetical protein